VDVLKAGFAEGRLSQDEYNDRMGQAYAARTYAELDALVRDLPAGPVPYAAPSRPAPYLRSARTNATAVAALVCGVAVPFAGITAIPAVICGHKARREIRRTGEQGDGMAVTGLVLGYAAIIFWVLLMFGAMVIFTTKGHPAPVVSPP
jgi:hypothetical protein